MEAIGGVLDHEKILVGDVAGPAVEVVVDPGVLAVEVWVEVETFKLN
jgi:hypothetical protein